jgi:ribosomal protein L12E/L44/L45/RPP1/RPP2
MALDRTYESVLDELEGAVRAHAEAHYDEHGWDILVETIDEDELTEIIRGARTVGGAISKAARHVAAIDAHRADVRGA